MRRSSLLPLMLVAALSLCLASCDDNKTQEDQEHTQKPAGQTLSDHYKKRSPEKAEKNSILVKDVVAYATAEGQSTSAVFFKITSMRSADALIGVKAGVGTQAQMHRTEIDDNGVAQMREVSRFKLHSGKIFVLTPTGYHIMILGLTKPLVEGETFNITLDFEKAEDMSVPVKVVAATQTRAAESHEHHTQAPVAPATATQPNLILAPPTDAPVINEHGSHEQH